MSPTHNMLHFLAFIPYVIYIFSDFSLLFLEIHLIIESHFHAWTKHFINSVLPLVILLHVWFQALSQQSELTKYLLWSAQRDQCGGITICKQSVYLASTIILTAKWKPRDLGDLKSLRKQAVSGKHLLEVEISFSTVVLHHL